MICEFSETRGPLQWQFGGPTRSMLSPWGVVDLPATCVHGRDVDMISAYFAPTWAMLRRIAPGRQARPRADHHRRQVRQ